MNKLPVLFFILFFLSCQRKSPEQLDYERYKDLIKSELIKIRLDTAWFRENATPEDFYGYSRYNFTDSNNVNVLIEKFTKNYQEGRSYPNSAFSQSLHYYFDGNLKMNFYSFKDFIIGELYEIDTIGNLHITDYDEPYKYNLDSLINFIDNLGYDINSPKIDIFRQWYYGVYIYSINIYDTLHRKINVDAVTGEILRDVAYSSWDWGIRGEDEEMRIRDILRSVSTKRGDECYGWEDMHAEWFL